MRLFLLLFFLLISFNLSALNKDDLENKIFEFEMKNSRSSVVIMEIATAKINYIYNREYAITRRFPPGSIAKVWTATTLLENNFHFSSNINCKGKFVINDFPITDRLLKSYNLPKLKDGKRYFRCSIRDGHGTMDLFKGLVDSCNVYFLKSCVKISKIDMRNIINFWHLNEGTSAKLKSGYEQDKFEINFHSPFQRLTSTIGEGGAIRVTPLKVAQTFSALFAKTPLLIPHEKKRKNKVIKQYSLNISSRTRRFILSTLASVLTDGTLKKLKIRNKKIRLIGGKSGSGTIHKRRYGTHGWNVICYQKKNKKYILVTFVEKGSGANEARKLSEVVLNAL